MTDTPWWYDAASGGRTGEGDSLGSAAAEAGRLFEALRERVVGDPTAMRAGLKMFEALSLLRGGASGQPVQPGEAPECAYCPVCQTIAHARDANPEALERLTTSALEFADALRQVIVPDSPAPDPGVRHVPLDEDLSAEEPEPEEAAADEATRQVPVDDEFLGWPDDSEDE